MVSFLILLKFLHVYILKQLFFSISVNSGFGNVYLSASLLGKNQQPLFMKKVLYFNFTILIPSFSEGFAELRYVMLRHR